MFGTDASKGFLYLKTAKGYYGLTPQDKHLANMIAEKFPEVETVNMNELSEEVKGKSLMEDNFYRLLYILNIIFIVGFALYLAIFFPGSGAPNFVVLLLVLAIAYSSSISPMSPDYFQFKRYRGIWSYCC